MQKSDVFADGRIKLFVCGAGNMLQGFPVKAPSRGGRR